MSLKDRFASAWNAFQSEPKRQEEDHQEVQSSYGNFGLSSFYRNDRHRLRFSNDRSILNTIFNRIANDVASVQIQHIRTDSNGRYLETIKSGLNSCLTLSANLDQTSRDFWLDLVLSMLDEGVIAAVPVDTDRNLDRNNSFDVLSLRTGQIISWEPNRVKMEVYNERTGSREQITLPKEKVAILENPFYSIMNEPNSTLKRLVHKMNLLDQIDSQKASTKLNMFIKLPYSLKSPTRVSQAEERRKAIEDQLVNSKYGIAYIDQAEQVTPLNRALDNDLPNQIQTLTDQLYNQIGISAEVFKGTANQEQHLIYNKKVLKPILDLIELEFTRKFLTPTARTQGQKIGYFLDAFDMVTPTEVGEMANSLSRNEILSANEFRSILGYKPNDSERSDQLINKNMPISTVDPNFNNPGANTSSESEEDSEDGHIDAEAMNNPKEIEEYLKQLNELEKQESLSHGITYDPSKYNPAERHARYLRDRAKLGIGFGRKVKASNKPMTKARKAKIFRTQVERARKASSLATDAYSEATRRKMGAYGRKMAVQQHKLQYDKNNPEEGVNYAMVRANVQKLSRKIRKSGANLNSWIKQERKALQSRLKTLYSDAGLKYKVPNERKQLKAQQARQRKVTKLADKLYGGSSKTNTTKKKQKLVTKTKTMQHLRTVSKNKK